ncbi:hypothetical protein CK203_012318 [Vitis vinifera]|uniref:Uncharacterized protein n=1 Tax=Vitis vinifera TaxID=29760 RepID=A0A438JKR3_VITVI|nr:hypothetical protein CK203_012318 [Vitis vinifera]
MECDLAKESQLGDLEEAQWFLRMIMISMLFQRGLSRSLMLNMENLSIIKRRFLFTANKMPQNMPRDESHHDISVDEAKDDDVEHWVEPNKSIGAASDGSQQKTAVDEAKDDGDCRVEPNKSSGSSDESQKKNSVDEAKDDGDHSSQPKASNDKLPNEAHHKVFVDEAKDDTEHCCEEEMLSDSTEYHDEEDVPVAVHWWFMRTAWAAPPVLTTWETFTAPFVHIPVQFLNTLSQEKGTSGDENDKPSSSTYYIRFRRQQQQYTFPPIHQLRRKKLAWTAKEEEILKVGVQKFSNDHDKSIPWKKIMEFGGTVFQRGRTTIDLKINGETFAKEAQNQSEVFELL